jgi:hypothetical protein
MSWLFDREFDRVPRPRPKRSPGGFNFTGAVRDVAADMIGRLPELAHIDLARVSVAFSTTRTRSMYGVQASLTPLRFEGGAAEGNRRGRRYRVQQVLDEQGREMLYIFTLYLPRFMDLDFREKLITILHELWHISPAFDGDIRRHPGRCHAHSSSKEAYDAEMARLAEQWLALGPDESLFAFLRHDYDCLAQQHGPLYGVRVGRPKLIPVD